VGRPRVLVTPWRRELKTALDPECDLLTIAPDYTNAVRRSGGLPIIAAHVEGDEIEELLDTVDALLLSGGQDMNPARYGQDNTSSRGPREDSDEFDLAIARAALDRGLPILGVCRGAQVLNVAMGGDLKQEVQAEGEHAHPTYVEMYPNLRGHRHEVALTADSRLAGLYGAESIDVNSLHHQAIGRVADGLCVVAKASDGVVEAVEGTSSDVVAVQWHPEMLRGEGGDVLFADLVERARVRATMTA